MEDASRILLLLLLILFSGLLSACETALTTLSSGRVHALVKNKKRGSISLQKLKNNPNRFLITILIGNNVVNIVASVYATLLFTDLFGSRGPGIAAGVMTLLILVFGEITPKGIAIKHAVGIGLFVSRPLLYIQYLLFPITWIMEHLLRFQMQIFGPSSEKSITEDELKALATIGAEEGSIQHEEKELIENVLEFNDIEVKDIMTPRTEINALEDNTLIHDAAQFISEQAHTRIPIYHETVDNIVGLISVRDILDFLVHKQVETPIRDLTLRKPYVIPTTKKINVLLKEFQRNRQNLAIVIDDHGGTAGLVTIEDILEEIVGEIIDEHDEQAELLKIIDKNTILVQGKTPIYEVNEALNIELQIEEYKPVSSLILRKIKRIPRQGEKFEIDNLLFRIENMIRNKIELVRIEKKMPKKKASNKTN